MRLSTPAPSTAKPRAVRLSHRLPVSLPLLATMLVRCSNPSIPCLAYETLETPPHPHLCHLGNPLLTPTRSCYRATSDAVHMTPSAPCAKPACVRPRWVIGGLESIHLPFRLSVGVSTLPLQLADMACCSERKQAHYHTDSFPSS